MDNYNIYGYNPELDGEEAVPAISALMQKVYVWMTLALAITGLTALCVLHNESLLFSLVNTPALIWGAFAAELVLVIALSANIMRLSFPVAGVMFGLYAIVNGLTLSVILLSYTMTSIASTFFVTAGMFGAMSLFGAFTKRNLDRAGRFLFMMLVGVIIATLVNLFVASTVFDWALTYLGIAIFSGLTAYDTQKMKEYLQQSEALGGQSLMKVALLCSLSLYLDFINLFLYLLRIFGQRK